MDTNSPVINSFISRVLTASTRNALDHLSQESWLLPDWYLAAGQRWPSSVDTGSQSTLIFLPQNRSLVSRQLSKNLQSNGIQRFGKKGRFTESYLIQR